MHTSTNTAPPKPEDVSLVRDGSTRSLTLTWTIPNVTDPVKYVVYGREDRGPPHSTWKIYNIVRNKLDNVIVSKQTRFNPQTNI